jgi:hypothetical protein
MKGNTGEVRGEVKSRKVYVTNEEKCPCIVGCGTESYELSVVMVFTVHNDTRHISR